MTHGRKKTTKAAWEAFDRLPKVEAALDDVIIEAGELTEQRKN